MSRTYTVLRLTPEALPQVTREALGLNGSETRERTDALLAGERRESYGEGQTWAPRSVSANLSSTNHLLRRVKPSYAGEQFRIARTKIVQRLKRPLRLAVTSPCVGDGKTVSSLNLAVAMALSSEARTLLIDADLRGAAVHKILELPPEPGLADVLSGACPLHEAMLAITNAPGLYVLPAGKTDANPTELFDSLRWRDLVDKARDDFAHIIVDCPPVDMVADSDLISAACDGVVLVLRPDHTNRSLCFSALAKVKPTLAGVLINDVDDWFLWKRNAIHDYGHYRRYETQEQSK